MILTPLSPEILSKIIIMEWVKLKVWWEATHFFSELLFQQSASGSSQSVNTTEDDYEVVGTVNDRSTLSDEMAAMCAKFPIYRIKRRKVTMSVEKENIQGICFCVEFFLIACKWDRWGVNSQRVNYKS